MDWNSILGLPISATMPLMKVTIFWISACAGLDGFRAWCRSSTSLAPASIMTIFSARGGNGKLQVGYASRCFSVGFTTHLAVHQAHDTRPRWGLSRECRRWKCAMDVPIMPAISGAAVLVHAHNGHHHRDVVAHVLGEQRTDGAVHNTGRQHRPFRPGRPSRRMEAAGDAAHGIQLFFISPPKGGRSRCRRGACRYMVTLHSTAVSP